MNKNTVITVLLTAALLMLASCASTPVYSDGSYSRAGAGACAEAGSGPNPVVQAQARPGDSTLVKGYGLFVSGIQNVAYGTMLTAAIVLYPFVGAGV